MNDERNDPGRPSGAETRFQVVVAALMVLIIVALAVLWLRERRSRLDAIQQLADMRSRELRTLLGAGGPPGLPPLAGDAAAQGGLVRPVQRDDHVPEVLIVDGRPRRVYRISSEAGGRIGFFPGDVILVAPDAAGGAQATQPAAP